MSKKREDETAFLAAASVLRWRAETAAEKLERILDRLERAKFDRLSSASFVGNELRTAIVGVIEVLMGSKKRK